MRSCLLGPATFSSRTHHFFGGGCVWMSRSAVVSRACRLPASCLDFDDVGTVPGVLTTSPGRPCLGSVMPLVRGCVLTCGDVCMGGRGRIRALTRTFVGPFHTMGTLHFSKLDHPPEVPGQKVAGVVEK
jgi:hypothetical protein